MSFDWDKYKAEDGKIDIYLILLDLAEEGNLRLDPEVSGFASDVEQLYPIYSRQVASFLVTYLLDQYTIPKSWEKEEVQ